MISREDYGRIPEATRWGIARYVEFGIMPGSFLQAVVENDLKGAIRNADQDSLASLAATVSWFHNHSLGTCYGSPERVEAWVYGSGDRPPRYYRADEALALLGLELVDGALRPLGHDDSLFFGDGSPIVDGPFAEDRGS